MAPDAGAVNQFRLPLIDVDKPAGPAGFDHETARREGIKREHVVVGVTAQCDCNALRVFQRHVVETPDVVDKIVFDHDVVNARPVEFNQRQGMVPGIDVHERSPERRTVRVITESQTDCLQVELFHFLEIKGLQHQVSETQFAASETADRTRR